MELTEAQYRHIERCLPTQRGNVTLDNLQVLNHGLARLRPDAHDLFLHAPAGYGARPANTGWFAAFDDLTLMAGQVGYAKDARRYAGATFDPSGLYRLNAVQRMLKAEGLSVARMNAHIDPLLGSLAAELDETGLGSARLLNPGILQPRARFLALESSSARRWQDAFAAADVVTDLRGDVLRIGVGLYHDEDDITRLIDIAAGF